MWGEEMVLQNDSYGTVAAKVVDIPLIFESQVSVVDSRDKSMVVVGTECGVIHEPDKIGAVRSECDVDSLSGGWGNKRDLAQCCGEAQRVVTAVLELSGGPTSGSGWEAVGVRVLVIDGCSCERRHTIRE